ncbi:Bug family tripartite tricarboxylate transporter substrate binding protein [Advenella sp. RU8]|uniref:Bug family tripartite tricarboxylate transporter substrate binding protein n=1 Tax=Advenella sp. RU8 TaxID=3399575 RepID=UPI003AACDC63
MHKRRFLSVVSALVVSLLMIPAAQASEADSFPNKNLRIIVSASVGGSSDKLARTIAQKLDEKWGVRTIVENHPGGGGSIANNIVAKAKPDGYTLLLAGDGLSIEAAQTSRKLPYDPLKDFTGVIKAVVNPLLIMVRPDLPVNNFKEYLEFLKANQGKTSLALSGAKNSHQHLAIELLSQLTDVPITVIPSLGGGPAMLDVMGGHIDAQIITLAAATENVRAGKLKGLGVTTPFRSQALPDVPTLQESGIDGYAFQSWQGLVAPAGTPDAVVQKIYSTVAEILNDPINKQALEDLGFIVTASAPDELNKTIQEDRVFYGEVANKANIKL